MKKLISVLLILALLLPCAFAGATYEESGMQAVLSKLGKDSYTQTYEALLEGEVLEKGASGDHAKALQRVLKAFGQDVSTDGKAGKGTFEKLNKVQKRYGMEQTDYVDAEVFAELLCALLVYQEGKDAEDYVLEAGMEYGHYLYCLARHQASDGHYYRARQSYEESGWADWAERAEKCQQKWPKKDGCIWKSKSKGSGSILQIKVMNSDSDTAYCYKVYNSDNKLVAVFFFAGNGSAETGLKPGRYTIKKGICYKDGDNTNWYGRKDVFGDAGSYYTLWFSYNEETWKFSKGSGWLVTSGGGGGSSVSSYSEDYDNF